MGALALACKLSPDLAPAPQKSTRTSGATIAFTS